MASTACLETWQREINHFPYWKPNRDLTASDVINKTPIPKEFKVYENV